MPADRAAPPIVVETAKQFLSSFKTPGLILVAVSGGSDSKGLLLALHAAITHGGFSAFSLSACTIDHALRSGSADEARAVAAFCAARGIPHAVRLWRGEKPATGVQAAARFARYGLLADAAQDMGARCIVTGHTADDQAETIAMRESRSQPDAPGLAGMADSMLFDRRAWVLRPFLGLRRGDIRNYLVGLGEDWLDDPSNGNPAFERVRVRTRLSRDIVSPAGRPIEAGEARRRSGERVAGLLAGNVTVFDSLAARVDPGLAANLGDPDCRRAVLSLAAVIGGRQYLPGRETVERLGAFLVGGQDGRMTAGRVVFDRRRSGVYLYREARGLAEIVVPPGNEAIWDDRFIVVNAGTVSLVVRGGADPAHLRAGPIAAGLPEAILKRGAKSAPSCLGNAPSAVRIETGISLYDTVLPRFDLMIANSIATLFGRDRYIAPPVHDVLTENTG